MNKELLYQDKKIFYRVIGNGKPVILVHGFGEDGEVWENQIEPPQISASWRKGFKTPLSENSYLNEKFKFIIPDLPGSGRSEMIDDMSMEGMAEVIKAIIDIEASPNPSEEEASPNPSEEEASPNPSEGGALDSDTSKKQNSIEISGSENPPSGGRGAFPNPSEGGALDSDTSKKQDSFEISESENPPSGGRGASLSGGRGASLSGGRGASLSGGRGASSSGSSRACLIGHSMGGYITLAFAEMYPDYLSGLGLFHSSAFADNEEKKTTRRKGIEFIQQHGAFEFLKTATPNLFSPITKDEQPGLIDKQMARLDNFTPAVLVSYYRAMMNRPDRTDILRKASVPVLFIMGKYDTAVPVEDGLKQCHLPEKSYIHILHQSGHMGMLEEPRKSKEMLEEFLLEI